MEMAAQGNPSAPNSGKRPRLECTLGDDSGAGPSNAQGQHHADVIKEHVEHLMLALKAATAEKEALEIQLNDARRRTEAFQTALRSRAWREASEAAETAAAMENFEANKVGWVRTAARVVAGITLRKLSARNEEPAEEVINACCDEAIETLELDSFEPEGDDLEGDLGGTVPAPQDPPQDIQIHHDDHEQGRAERVDIPDRLTDVDYTPQPSTRPPADDSVVILARTFPRSP